MNVRKVVIALAVVTLALCGAVQADYVTIVTGDGRAYTVDEFDLSIVGQVSTCNYGKSIYSAAGNSVNGDIVLGFADGTAAVAKYNSLGTFITSGTVGNGTALTGAAVRPNGELYFTNVAGWAYARSHTNVTATPSGYTLPADLLLISGTSPYLYVATGPLDEVLFVASDRKETWIRRGNNMSLAPSGYLYPHMYWDRILTAKLILSTGDIVLSQMGTTGDSGAQIFVRDNANMSIPPAGYVGSGAILGTGAYVRAIARTADDLLIIGNDSGQIFLRYANNLTTEPFPGNSYAAGFPWGPTAMAVTSNNNVVIGLYNGQVYVRSLDDIDGSEVAPSLDFTAGNEGIVAIIPHDPTPTNCDEITSQGKNMTGDLNRDCYVNIDDLALFALDWLTEYKNPEVDFLKAGLIPDSYSGLGYEPEVPAPWTPVVVNGATVNVWNRAVTFGGNGLPENITSAGMNVLSGPVVLRAFADNLELLPAVGTAHVTKLSDGSAEATGSMAFSGLSVNTRSLIEFDGCIRIELEVLATGTGPDSFILDIPLSSDFAELINSHKLTYVIYEPTSSGSIPAGTGVVWNHDYFVPFIWLGNTKAGLSWFAASQKGWMVAPATTSEVTQEIIRTGSEVKLRVHLADRAFPLGQVRQIVFGLQPTPVKPIRADWRLKERYGRHPMAPPELLCNSVLFEPFGKWWGWPEPKSDALVTKMQWDIDNGLVPYQQDREPVGWPVLETARNQVHADGGRIYWYAPVHQLANISPWYRLYGKDWELTEGVGYENATDEWYNAEPVCPASKWQDLYIGTIATRSLPIYDFDGVYLDTYMPYKCKNAAHGCGYIDDYGVRQGEYTIWPMREQMKRLYRVVHAKAGASIIGHISSTPMPPIYSFIDSALSGEQYWTYFQVQGGVDYHTVLPLDKCRTEVMGRQWGWAPLWLPEFKTAASATSRELLSLILLHDSLILSANMDGYEANISNKYLWELGFVNSEFVGYFDSPPPATASSPNIYVSAYKDANGIPGDVILIITNHGLTGGTFNIVPNLGALGLSSGWTAIEKQYNMTLTNVNDAFDVYLPGKDFTIVSISSN